MQKGEGKTMQETIAGIACLVVGLSLMFFRESFGRFCIDQQNKTWGFSLGASAIKAATIIGGIVGICFAVIGLFLLLHLIHFRK
jgi:hypothetical protein